MVNCIKSIGKVCVFYWIFRLVNLLVPLSGIVLSYIILLTMGNNVRSKTFEKYGEFILACTFGTAQDCHICKGDDLRRDEGLKSIFVIS